MKKLFLILIISITYLSLFSQNKTERYSCKTPVVAITGTVFSFIDPEYYWYAEYSVSTFNCRCISSGVVAGYYNSTPDYNYLGNIVNETPNNLLYFQANTGNRSAGINQVPFYARAYVITDDGIFYSDNVRFAVSGSIPIVSTNSVSSIGTYYATSGGSISSDGGNIITDKGVVWGFDSGVSITNYIGITHDGTGSSSFSSSITGLTQGTTYYVKAYATTSIGTGYGDAIQFTTQQSVTVPTVSTTTPYSITSTYAYSGGSVTYSGGGSIIERGVCWNTSGTPNYNNSKITDGTGTGSFTSLLSSLSPNTTYYVRAYAKSSGIVNGFTVSAVGYGEEYSFTTNSEGSCVLASLTTTSISNITESSASSGGNISSDGGCAISARGVQWSLYSDFSTILGNTSDGSGTGSFTSYITSLTCGTIYYVRSYAANSVGTAYGNTVNFTTSSSATVSIASFSSVTSTSFTANCNVISSCSNVTSRGIIYSTSPGVSFPTNANASGSGTGSFSVTPYSTLNQNTTYYVKAYAIVNSTAIYLSAESTVTTLSSGFDPCTLAVGDSYEGGIVAYIYQSGDPGYVSGECHGIIAATSDQSSGIQWYNGSYVNVSGLSSELNSGSSNTDMILYVQGYNYVDYAAGLARSYTGGGFSDWCLPSLNDLIKLYNNKSVIGGFSSSRYWASGQRFASAIATMVDFSNGDYSNDWNKAYLYHVRAIRYF